MLSKSRNEGNIRKNQSICTIFEKVLKKHNMKNGPADGYPQNKRFVLTENNFSLRYINSYDLSRFSLRQLN